MLIGINGFLGSGKDTVYKRIKELYEMSGREQEVTRISFADKLKLSAAAALGVGGEEAIDWMNRVKDGGEIIIKSSSGVSHTITGRQYLQYYGTEAHRDVFGDNFWVDQALPNMSHYGQVVCVTDVRFDNEIARVKEMGGMIWHVAGVDDSMSGTHASEKPIDPDLVDVFISNNIRDDQYRYLDDQIIRALSLRNLIVR